MKKLRKLRQLLNEPCLNPRPYYWVTGILALVMILSGMACQKQAEKEEVVSTKAGWSESSDYLQNRSPHRTCIIVAYGPFIYYFNCVEGEFGNNLNAFLQSKTNLEVTAMTPNIVRQNGIGLEGNSYDHYRADYAAPVGYFVTFREKEVRK